ncbi:neutral/alkaline non-lysosomal ceramidase N-terminal domain-containing protein [Cyclobacterium jeungdonense]|uniref:Neutral/alkaline non-lysosomal ceramidase N-terminal domain-containing protein n=1 Tax=Cyclobacterium jeungdonense TaxID=708087 RepID=A0ABT8C8Z0_9BACT|nr:neutral/alkaline non-lysosomal ceramidase N-terminal domain-containing protein [Cyclobacterium jeungdonense]MDN3688832.1 neutral/alkaline non-lysosomal ceramidase N-terminal domain-containing protein [Cyclobacterium jeungdonense]
MKNDRIKIPIFSPLPILILLLVMLVGLPLYGQNNMVWKTGTDKFKITPQTPLWMAGYGHRDHPAQGKYSELWVKVIAFEDQQGNTAVLLTSDLLGLPGKMSEKIRTAIYQQYGLTKSQVILNSSHTHSGPVLEAALYDIYPLDEQQQQRISEYSRQLEQDIVESVGRALENRAPSRVYAANGTARFQVNRRNNKESEIHLLTELKGPIDHAVPVIKVTDLQDRITAVLFGYACHPTVLSQYSWSADYPGYAQETLEENHPGAMALFFQGAAGDQNPLPRRTVPLARQYGKELAAAVERVLEEDMKTLDPELSYAYEEIDLALNPPMSRETLETMIAEESGYMKRWAERMLEEQKKGLNPDSSYPFPIQVWKLGEQVLFSMGGESTIGYANRLKAKYGPEVFVMAYSNDVMGYIPTEIILQEGGYEGYSSQMVYGLHNSWKAGLEEQILSTFDALARQLTIPANP